jgi:uncharacterized protein (TIGR02301 family)
MRGAFAGFIVLIFLAAAQGAPAQSRKTPPEPAAPVEEPPAPYEPQLLRLSEILGALTYLRDLCGADDGAKWRAQMNALMASEGASDGRKARLAGSFNQGFRGFERSYRTCTPNAELIISRYIAEGEKIAADVASRYGGG